MLLSELLAVRFTWFCYERLQQKGHMLNMRSWSNLNSGLILELTETQLSSTSNLTSTSPPLGNQHFEFDATNSAVVQLSSAVVFKGVGWGHQGRWGCLSKLEEKVQITK